MSRQEAMARDALDRAERDELLRQEAKIQAAAQTFVDAGQALVVIRDRRLYRETHATFEDYCRQRWGFNRSRASQLIGAHELSTIVDTAGMAPLRNEAQARELIPLRDEPKAVCDALAEARQQHGPQPTAAQIREVVRPPEPPGSDMRFSRIENAADSLRTLPPVSQLAWPTEPGDVAAMDDALAFLDGWLPTAKAAWRQHKAAMREARQARP